MKIDTKLVYISMQTSHLLQSLSSLLKLSTYNVKNWLYLCQKKQGKPNFQIINLQFFFRVFFLSCITVALSTPLKLHFNLQKRMPNIFNYNLDSLLFLLSHKLMMTNYRMKKYTICKLLVWWLQKIHLKVQVKFVVLKHVICKHAHLCIII